MRRALAIAIGLTFWAATTPPAGAADPSAALASAKARANAAAARSAAAQTELAKAERRQEALKAQLEDAESRLAVLKLRVRTIAVARYTRTMSSGVQIHSEDLSEEARGEALLRTVSGNDSDSLEEYRVAADDLRDGRKELEKVTAEKRKAAAELKEQEAATQAEVQKLTAVLKEYEAKRAAAARSAARPSRARPVAGASPRVLGSGNWICPVQGPRAFTNDWGQPRSGGRSHQGTDIMSPRGTPVVASVSGTVRGHNSSLGGISYYLNGDDGNTYFGTHLNSLSGASGRVSAGTVVGYVGTTGNASGGSPHLHFEIHPGGGGAVNPYPTLRQYC